MEKDKKEIHLEELPFGDKDVLMLLRCGKPNHYASQSMIKNVLVNIHNAKENGTLCLIPADFDLIIAHKNGKVEVY